MSEKNHFILLHIIETRTLRFSNNKSVKESYTKADAVRYNDIIPALEISK